MTNGHRPDLMHSLPQCFEVVLEGGDQNTKFWLVLNVENVKLILPLEDWLNSMNVKHVKECSLAEMSKWITNPQ